MTHPKHGRISLSSPITSKSGDTAVEREWTHNMSSGVGDRSLAQHLQSLKEQDVAEGEFAGDYKTGPEGQWRNKGPKANKPAKVGDLVGASESVEPTSTMLEGQEDLDAILRIIKK